MQFPPKLMNHRRATPFKVRGKKFRFWTLYDLQSISNWNKNSSRSSFSSPWKFDKMDGGTPYIYATPPGSLIGNSKVKNSSSFSPTISSQNIGSYSCIYIEVPLSNVPVSLLAEWVVPTTPPSDLNVKIMHTLTWNK